MQKNYVAPHVEVLEIEVEDAVLAASLPVFNEGSPFQTV